MRDFLPKWKSAATRRSNSARPPQKERPQLQNDEIVRDFLNFRSCQRQKRSNSATSFQKKVEWKAGCMLSCLLMRQKNILSRKVTPGYTQSCASRAKITFANLKLSISEMSPLSRNQRLDPRTCLMVREMHLCRSSSNASRLHRFLQLLQDPHVAFSTAQLPKVVRP